MNKQKGFTLIELLVVLFCVVGIVGWIANIWPVVTMLSAPVSLLLLKAFGIVAAPLGSVLGIFGMF